jgi:FSR family fosmidomycin resistance protein-like MFS transporter
MSGEPLERTPPLAVRSRTSWAAGAGVMALGHFANDVFASFLGPLLPLLVAKFSLSLALAGLLGTTFNIAAAFGQPLFGLAADRTDRPVFAVVGPLATASMMGLLGVAPSYPLLLLALVLAGIGTASFHPQAFALVGTMSQRHRGTGLSIFVAGGELGFAFGPLYVAAVVTALGLPGTVVAALPAVGVCVVLWWAVRSWRVVGQRPSGGVASDLRRHARALLLIWFVVVVRSVIVIAHILFLPLLLRQQGQSLIFGGGAVFLFGGVGAVGGLIGGILSDRVGRRAVMAASLVAGAPLLLVFHLMTGPAALVPLALGGLVLYLGAAVTVVMAQEMLPRRASLASSLVTGLAWGVAGISLTAIGAVADRIGLGATLASTLALAIPALAATWWLPETGPRGATEAATRR